MTLAGEEFLLAPDKIATAVAETFENMAFLETRYIGREAFTSSCLWIRLPIIAPIAGEMIFALPEDLAQEIATNVLGNPQPAKSDIMDMAAEMANVIAGRLFAAASGAVALGLPCCEHGKPPAGDWDIFALDDARRFAVICRLRGGDKIA